MIIGIIGVSGDLGSQLHQRMVQHGTRVLTYSRKDGDKQLQRLAQQCDIIHVCAPVAALDNLPETAAIVVLHDSVMNTSRRASQTALGGSASVVHMLMNDHQTVFIASDVPHHDSMAEHFTELGYNARSITIDEHDYLMARSQAPFALLCKTLLPFLYEQADQGFLTPSGQLLADTLRARELAWTDATIWSILQNPQLTQLINDMNNTLTDYQPVSSPPQSTKKHPSYAIMERL